MPTPIPIPISHSSGRLSSDMISRTPTTRWKLARSAAPSSGDARRSPRGTRRASPTGPTEAVNNLIKRVKRAAFGFTSFRNYRIRLLLYAGKPDCNLLAAVTPR
jgi:Transposase